ncbi:MAG: ABC transporter ATP-binding protein [Candidatus Eisenbacteria bacterium]|uniref:ABC transporter ATP-binding protein n=1 Tax=Eiseniibacteriota bacterium TaxID=2212470 RepID=A0A933SBX2_UNCEI|nr:ABC transporter ATP-binding protein [Candidatus Eisenbacteria bacterium]
MIKIRDLKIRLGKKQVLNGVDLDIPTGKTVVVMGRSGTGKSVLFKNIIGLMHPDSGSIEVDGQEVVGIPEKELNEVRKRFGVLFQSGALFDSMTVGENVGLPLREHTKLPDAEIRKRVADRLEWVGLKGVEAMKPASLSGGMRKRVGLARAIAMDPAYILYDEPTTGLDPIMSDVINRLIRSLQERIGVTSIVVTHDMNSAYHVADEMALLNEGRVVFTGTPDEARSTSDPIVRQFIEGSSEGPIKPL